MLPEVIAYLETHWRELDTFGVRPRRYSYLMQDRNRPSCFIFVDGESEPRFIAKFARTKANRVFLRHEHEMITSLHALAPSELADTVPRPLAFLTLGRDLAAIETVLPGAPMASTDIFTTPSRAIEQQFTLVYTWLLAFQRCTRWDVLLDGAEVRRLIITPLAQRLPNIDLPTDVRTGIDSVLILADELEGCTFPLTFYHGDMKPDNFLLSQGRITGVVDWEYAGRESLPTMDWFNFMLLFGWMTLLHRRTYPSFKASRLDAIVTTFFSDNPFSRLSREWAARFLAYYDIDIRFTALLLLHALFKLHPENEMLADIILGVAAVTGNAFIPFRGLSQ